MFIMWLLNDILREFFNIVNIIEGPYEGRSPFSILRRWPQISFRSQI